jgi:hypothetical protein
MWVLLFKLTGVCVGSFMTSWPWGYGVSVKNLDTWYKRLWLLYLFEYLTPLWLQPQVPAEPSKLPEVGMMDNVAPISDCESMGDYVVF